MIGKFKTYFFWDHVSEFNVLRPGDGRGSVIVDQFIERVELDDPEEELALGVTEHFKMLYAVTTPTRNKK